MPRVSKIALKLTLRISKIPNSHGLVTDPAEVYSTAHSYIIPSIFRSRNCFLLCFKRIMTALFSLLELCDGICQETHPP
jgi:hypothetical protein